MHLLVRLWPRYWLAVLTSYMVSVFDLLTAITFSHCFVLIPVLCMNVKLMKLANLFPFCQKNSLNLLYSESHTPKNGCPYHLCFMFIFEKVCIPVVDSIDQVGSFWFLWDVFYHIQNFNKNHIIPVPINTFKLNSQHITFCLQPSIMIFKLHPLTVTMVTKFTYYY